jgi:uncharacterized protein DUF1963
VVAPVLAPGGDEAAGIAAAAAYPPDSDHVVWDARRSAREDDLPEPAVALDGLAEPLAAAIRDAARATVGDVALIAVRMLPWSEDRPFVFAAAASAKGRARIRRAGAANAAEVAALAFAETAETGPLDVVAHADDELARRLRAAQQALTGLSVVRAERVAALAPELAAALGDDAVVFPAPEEAPLPGPALATLTPIVERAGRAGAALPEAVAALLAEAGVSRLDEALAEPGHYAPHDLPVSGRAVLAALLEAVELAPEDAATVAADARWALVLEEDPAGASWLGGLPVLPRDVAWPTADGRALSHLATLACDALPAVERRDVLPPDGHLSLFADLTEAAEVYEPIAPGGRRELIRIVHTPPGVPTHSPEPDPAVAAASRDRHDPPAVLEQARVRAVPRLQLRHVGFGFADHLWSIDALGERAIGRLLPAVNGRPRPQLLGWPLTAQDDPREADADAEVLFHLGHHNPIGFHVLDAGDMMFFAPPAALRAHDWDQVTVWPSSC